MKLRLLSVVAVVTSWLSSSAGITIVRMEASQMNNSTTIVEFLRKSAQREQATDMIKDFTTAATIHVDEPRAYQDSGRRHHLSLVHASVSKKTVEVGLYTGAPRNYYADSKDTNSLFDEIGALKIDKNAPDCIPSDWRKQDPKGTVRESIHFERAHWFAIRVYFCASSLSAQSASVYLGQHSDYIGRITFTDAKKIQKTYSDIKHKSEEWTKQGGPHRRGF